MNQEKAIAQTRITDHIELKIGKYQHKIIEEYGDRMGKKEGEWLDWDCKMLMKSKEKLQQHMRCLI